MEGELEERLKAFAKEHADDIYSLDIQTLRDLVVEGGKWMYDELKD